MTTTFVERANTNEVVFKRVNEAAGKKKTILPLSETYLHRKDKFFCKVLTEEDCNPIRETTLLAGRAKPRIYFPRRVGRPKIKWAPSELKRIWEKARQPNQKLVIYNPSSQEQELQIEEWAKEWLKNPRMGVP